MPPQSERGWFQSNGERTEFSNGLQFVALCRLVLSFMARHSEPSAVPRSTREDIGEPSPLRTEVEFRAICVATRRY